MVRNAQNIEECSFLFDLPNGGFTAVLTDYGIRSISFPPWSAQSTTDAVSSWTRISGMPTENINSLAEQLFKLLEAYWNGERVEFDLPLDLDGPSFYLAIWRVLGTVPWGKTRTYGWLAAETGKPGAARAAGSACARNPIPIILPCHRILPSSGKPGNFSSGPQWKRKMLEMEGSLVVG